MADQTAIACSEVWGSNRFTQTTLSLPGIQGWVIAKPHAGAVAGGDLHYVSSCGTGRITRVLLADVAGHGDSVAPLADRLRRLMQRYMNHIDPRKLARALNQDLTRAGQAGEFVTAVVLTYFAPNGTLTLCNAAHPSPAIYRAAQRRWGLVDRPDSRQETGATNLPLGVLEESGYTGRELVLEPDDAVLAYSDCLVEARKGERQLGEDGLVEVLNAVAVLGSLPGAADVIDRVLAEIESRGYVLDDDLTAVLLQCTGRAGGAPLPQRLAGMFRSALRLASRDGPWPEMSKWNVLGQMFPRVYRRK